MMNALILLKSSTGIYEKEVPVSNIMVEEFALKEFSPK